MKKSRNGKLIISLDFEKMWGIHDSCLWEEKIVYIKNVNIIVPKLLELFNKYEISATWATVGMLFFNNKKELLDFTNNIEFPTYDNLNFSPYLHFDKIKDDDEVSFANDLIKKIMSVPNQEIGSHTFSHYYCGESGQNPKQFKQDLDLSLKISKINNLSVTSLVFPKNQYNNEYIKIAKECGIKAYRGLESSWINKLKNKNTNSFFTLLVSTKSAKILQNPK